MKTLHLIAFAFFVIASTAGAEQRPMLARVTTYWKSEGGGVRASWNGARLNAGHCAVDPKKIPYGSKVMFSDTTCIAVDTGPDVVNRKAARCSGRTATQRSAIVIDRFFETRAQAQRWMAENGAFMTVQIESSEHHARSTSTSFQLSLGLDAPVSDHVKIAQKELPQPSLRATKRRT